MEGVESAIKINGELINNLLVLPTENTIQFKSDGLLLWAERLRNESQDRLAW